MGRDVGFDKFEEMFDEGAAGVPGCFVPKGLDTPRLYAHFPKSSRYNRNYQGNAGGRGAP